MRPHPAAKACSVCKNEAPAGIGTPEKLRTWLATISIAAPAVKPTTTVCEMKLTSTPSRASPIASWIRPTIKLRVSTSVTYWLLPGSAICAMVAKTTSEIALVGPETRCQLDPHNAATIAGTIAA